MTMALRSWNVNLRLGSPGGYRRRREAGVAVTGVVVDDGEFFRALFDERVDQLGRHARRAEAADHDGRAVMHVGNRRLE